MKGRIGLMIRAGLLAVSLAASMVQAQESVTRVTVFATGTLLLNDRPATLAAVEAEFKAVKSNNGRIWYYREHARAEPPPEAMAVIELAGKYGLPISLSSRPDFSDYIDQHGNSKPRKP